MRGLVPLVVAAFLLFAFIGTLGFLWWKSREVPVIYEVETPTIADIVDKTVATGAINARTEVEIKPRVSGVVASIDVQPGDLVTAGQLIATIRIQPDVAALERAQSAVQAAKIALDDASVQFARSQSLRDSGAISIRDLETARVERDLKAEEADSAQHQLQIVREGRARGQSDVSTDVRSTVKGMVLSVDVKAGESVTEINTFNAGSTIAVVADMNDLIFDGHVDESEVGKLKEKMPLVITVGALEDKKFDGALEYISPKGVLTDGAVQFEIKAAIKPVDGVFIRAGSSANADVVLDRRDHVLSIPESLLEFDGDKPYVEVETTPQHFERRDVQVGLSDGLRVEIKGGVTLADRIRGGEKGPDAKPGGK